MSEDWWKKHGRPLDPAIFVRIVEEEIIKKVKPEVCSCGEKKCRKRKPSPILDEALGEFRLVAHERPVTEVRETIRKWGGYIPLEEVVPGHPRFERAVAYAARDSVVALYLNDRTDQLMNGKVPFPWAA